MFNNYITNLKLIQNYLLIFYSNFTNNKIHLFYL